MPEPERRAWRARVLAACAAAWLAAGCATPPIPPGPAGAAPPADLVEDLPCRAWRIVCR